MSIWDATARIMAAQDEQVQQSLVAVRTLLTRIGEDPDREGLKDTPKRVLKSFSELYGGYTVDEKSLFTTFEDGKCKSMVVVSDIDFYSMCEHHMLPFFGKATIAYIPDGKIIGLSKLARILDMYARRLQVQERLTEQVTDCLERNLKPKGSACIISATHFCMSCRGVKRPNAITTTSSLTGVFEAEASCRAELMSFINKG